jgi:CRP/FNR family cyclic AMP-dependent transcriptional regulator
MNTQVEQPRRGPSLTLLHSIPIFAGVPDSQLEQIAKVAFHRRVPRQTTIVRAGDSTDSLYVLISGGAKVLNSDEEGREVILTLLGPGEFFGEMGLIDGSPRSADVMSTETCELLVITKNDFKRCLAENFDLCLNIMKSLVQRLREADRNIESLALMDVYGRVAKLLIDFSEEERGQRVIRRRLTKQDIAKMIGASREMVSRVMKDLENRGYFRVEEGRIVILEKRVPAPARCRCPPALKSSTLVHSPSIQSQLMALLNKLAGRISYTVASAESAAREDRAPPAGIALADPDRHRQLSLACSVGLPSSDPGWSHAVHTTTLHNPAGRSGAWLADLMLYVFGLSAWWWIILLLVFVWWGYRRLDGSDLPTGARCTLPWPAFWY